MDLPAEFHYWTLIMRNGDVLKGMDDYPTPMCAMQAKAFILETRDTTLELQIPEGHKLIFKRRVQIIMTEGGEECARPYKYILGTEPYSQMNEARAVDHAPP